MFTQCTKCKAIFRVNLREVTIAKGKLRCGECYAVFDATKTLSTTMPAPFQKTVDLEIVDTFSPVSRTRTKPKKNYQDHQNNNTISNRPSIENLRSAGQQFKVKSIKTLPTINKWLLATILLLIALFAFQIFYNIKLKAIEEPLHEPEKIQMLSSNVFAHPNESGVLLISASMENNANRAQPYPVVEVILSDSKSKVIALRRFRPAEYLQNYKKGMLINSHQQSKINLKISDPGSKAVRFQYKFF